MKEFEIYTITEDVSMQETIAEVVKLLLKQEFSYDTQLKGVSLIIKPFYNCRESGYMYRLQGAAQEITFCVYEHRNSDALIINGCWTKDVQPYGAYNLGGKWDYLDNFRYDQHYEVAKRLAKMLHETYCGTFNTSVLLQGES